MDGEEPDDFRHTRAFVREERGIMLVTSIYYYNLFSTKLVMPQPPATVLNPTILA